MSIDNLQNLNEETFEPDYGADSHDIPYSCGHINPLQRALKNNLMPKIENIKANLESFKIAIEDMIEDANYIKNEVMNFATNRCEAIRSINSELRGKVDSNCECNKYCDNCDTLSSDKECLREEVSDLECEKNDLSNEIENLQDKINFLQNQKEEVEKSFKEVNEKYSYLKLIFDKIIKEGAE